MRCQVSLLVLWCLTKLRGPACKWSCRESDIEPDIMELVGTGVHKPGV